MTDRSEIFAPLMRGSAALLDLLVLITCHKGAAAGSV
jgi:hypothetical protein